MRFDPDILRNLAGDRSLERGQSYYRDGRVEILAIEPGRVLAQVMGEEVYRTELLGQGDAISGSCSCRAFEDFGFCKHMVAAALAANAVASDAEAVGSGAMSRIRGHLRDQSVDKLVEMIIDLAEQDTALFRRLDIAAAALNVDDPTLGARLRAAIDRVTRTGDYIAYAEVPGWAADVDAVLDAVEQLVAAGRGPLARELVELAIDRIGEAIEAIDDSDGHCGALLSRCGEIHFAAVQAAPPEPVQLARDLFAREIDDEYDTFYGAVVTYAEILGETGLAEYRRLAAEVWAKLPLRSRRPKEPGETGYPRHRIMNTLDFFAERDGDVDARIALRAKDLASTWDYLSLAEFCISQGREEEALRRAQEGLWVFEDEKPDERLVSLTARLLSKAGRVGEAEELLTRAFEAEPSQKLYDQLCECGGSAARDRAIAFLRARSVKERPNGWYHPADLLVRILTDEEEFDLAWTIIRESGASMRAKEVLARASEATHPREAVETYAERVSQLAEGGGGNPAYADAVALVARMAALHSATEHQAYLAELKTRFSRKRNFMKLLG